MLDFKKIKQKLNVIWMDFIYFLNIFKISKGINSFVLENILDDFCLSFNLMSLHKLILVPYAIFLFIAGYYLQFHEYLSQSNMIVSFTLITIMVCVTLLFMFLLYLPFVIMVWLLISLFLKLIFRTLLDFFSALIVAFLLCDALYKYPIKIDALFHWLIVDTYIVILIVIIITVLIIRSNVNKLYDQEPILVKQNFILKFVKFDKPLADKIIRIMCVLFIIPFLVFQTTSYKVILLDFLKITNQIIINNPIPLNYQQYQLLQPQNKDCQIDKYDLDLIFKHQISEDKQVCIQPSNILKQGFADEYILMVKREDKSVSKIYCVNNKCNGVSVRNEKLAEILLEQKPNQLTDYFSKH